MSLPKLKVSQMSVAVNINPTDYFMIVQNGLNKKTSITTLLKNMNTGDTININPLQNAVDFIVGTKNDPNCLFADGSMDFVGIGTAYPASKFHVNGNAQVGSASTDGIIVESTEALSFSSNEQTNNVIKPISPMRSGSIISCDTGVSGKFLLPAGSNGQVKTIAVNSLGSGKTVTVTTVGTGFNTITLSHSGESVVLKYFTTSSSWIVIGGHNPTITTV